MPATPTYPCSPATSVFHGSIVPRAPIMAITCLLACSDALANPGPRMRERSIVDGCATHEPTTGQCSDSRGGVKHCGVRTYNTGNVVFGMGSTCPSSPTSHLLVAPLV